MIGEKPEKIFVKASYNYQPKIEEKPKKKNIFVGFFVALGKIGSKAIPVVTKLLKGAKVVKIGLAVGSVVSYAFLTTWTFAIAIMVCLFVHESGHIWAAKRHGLKVKGIYFIPFIGGAAVIENDFKSRNTEFVVAIMGPVWGFALTIITGIVYFITLNPLFAAIAGWMAFVNLFNLLPISPLDGGRIFKSIGFSLKSWLGLGILSFGLLASTVLFFWLKIGLFALLMILGVIEIWFEWKKLHNYQSMTHKQIGWALFFFFSLALSLFGVMYYFQHIPEVSLAKHLLGI